MSLLAILADVRRGLAQHHQRMIDALLVHEGANVAIAYAKACPR